MDYTKIVVDDVYTLLTSIKNPWPKNFSKIQKLKILDTFIEYYENNDEFEKCSMLKKIHEGIQEEPILKIKRGKNV